ncbi:MAG: hypothetical protein EOP84_02480 [Verrucomicrobiaceae bacterium]|nr:MAG: hypothetical protein EOP84_02480 [Verrucomicrobiaceae bacterium]
MSKKVAVFEIIFGRRYDEATGTLRDPLITKADVVSAIVEANLSINGKPLSTENPANFMKDYLRLSDRNGLWPVSIRSKGFTARQRTGDGRCFEFVSLAHEAEPFPDDFVATGLEKTFVLQTLSLPVTTRALVRADEQSIAQLSVKLNLIEHFLASSPEAAKWGLREITHLQNGVKLRDTEIDSLYQAVIVVDGKELIGAVAAEIKTKDPIIAEQIANQAIAILNDKAFSFCIPVILTRSKRGEVVAIHLKMLRGADIVPPSAHQPDPTVDLGGVAYSAKYEFRPPLERL